MSSNTDVALVQEDKDVPSFAQKPFRSSIPVPNVQEMVRNDPLQVPKRYIRNEEDMPKEAHICHHLSSEIPIIDFSLLSKGYEEELNKLDLACKEWGFFQVIHLIIPNHTVLVLNCLICIVDTSHNSISISGSSHKQIYVN